MKTIYLVSDSHRSMFLLAPSNIAKFELLFSCSCTAYSLNKLDQQIQQELAKLPAGSDIWFIFGEIDCRYRIFSHHYLRNIPLDIIIDNAVNSYTWYVNKIKHQGFKVSIVGAIPQTRKNKIFPTGSNDDKDIGPLGIGGIDEDRRYITEVFNSKLKYSCFKYKIKFVDIYPYLVNNIDGMNNVDMLYDYIHYGFLGDSIIGKLITGE